MTYYEPPHEVRDEEKLESMINTLKSGRVLPPIVVYGYTALTGSHRIAAWESVEIAPSIVEITETEYMHAIALSKGFDDLDFNNSEDVEFYYKYIDEEINDYNEFCEALLNISDNEDVLNAVKDQT